MLYTCLTVNIYSGGKPHRRYSVTPIRGRVCSEHYTALYSARNELMCEADNERYLADSM